MPAAVSYSSPSSNRSSVCGGGASADSGAWHFRQRASEAAVVLIQTGADHPHAPIRQRFAYRDDLRPEELDLVYPNHLRFGVQVTKNFLSPVHRRGHHVLPRVTHHELFVVADVESRFEHLSLLLGVERELDSADQLLRLAREHRAADHLYPPGISGECVHGG